MANKLYTTYIARMKHIPKGMVTAIIMRMPPASILKMEHAIHAPQLSPKKEVLVAYKESGDWNTFVEKFNDQMYNDEETSAYINLLMEALEQNEVCLVCCEKDANQCHRSLIAKYLEELGYESEEI